MMAESCAMVRADLPEAASAPKLELGPLLVPPPAPLSAVPASFVAPL